MCGRSSRLQIVSYLLGFLSPIGVKHSGSAPNFIEFHRSRFSAAGDHTQQIDVSFVGIPSTANNDVGVTSSTPAYLAIFSLFSAGNRRWTYNSSERRGIELYLCIINKASLPPATPSPLHHCRSVFIRYERSSERRGMSSMQENLQPPPATPSPLHYCRSRVIPRCFSHTASSLFRFLVFIQCRRCLL